METATLKNSFDVAWLKENYFTKTDKQIELKQGGILLHPGQENHRLYLVLKGTLVGTIEDAEGEPFEIFRSTSDSFVGVYSFFAEEHKSYSTVTAHEDTTLAYIEAEIIQNLHDGRFEEHFLPVIVNEIYLRQLWAQRVSIERQAAMKKLLQNEKMVMLGQIAAGLAHELNNSIGMIQRKIDWLKEWFDVYLENKEPSKNLEYFNLGFEEGLINSTKDIRTRKKELEKKYGYNASESKMIARMALSDEKLKGLETDNLEMLSGLMDAGVVFHDIKIAAEQAEHVVTSVKELGLTRRVEPKETDINQTIHEALALTKRLLIDIELKLNLNDLSVIMSHPGDLVQVWVNLIKNAVEVLKEHNIKGPIISIETKKARKSLSINFEDNGPGIPEELLPRIFEANVTTKVKGLSFGLGLGLSIVQKIITAYGGQINVKSEPGKTIFEITIPT